MRITTITTKVTRIFNCDFNITSREISLYLPRMKHLRGKKNNGFYDMSQKNLK